MTETITLIEPGPNEGLRQMFRKLWSEPQNTAFRNALRAQPENMRWVTLAGTDPLPEVD